MDLNLKLVIGMARAYNDMFSEIQKNIQTYGFNISEFGVLEMLLHKGEQPVQKIAEKILVTSGTITYVINKLHKDGLVQRCRCSRDRRVWYIGLTDSGRERIEAVFPEHQAFLNRLFETMSPQDKEALLTQLGLLKNTVEAFAAGESTVGKMTEGNMTEGETGNENQ